MKILNKRDWPVSALLLALTTTVAGTQASEQPSGEALAHPCAGCHGTYGRLHNEAFMPLAGMSKETFIRNMLDFQKDRRQGTLMGHVAKGLSKEEIERMAAFFASLDPIPASASGNQSPADQTSTAEATQ